MISHLVDTSLLVRQADTSSEKRLVTLAALQRLPKDGDLLRVLPQNMMEFWVVATRPHSSNGLGLSIADAEGERQRLERLFPLLPDPPDLYLRWVQLVNHFGVSGKPAHDARIVAAMLYHVLSHILTFNGRDFLRYAPLGIIVVDPESI